MNKSPEYAKLTTTCWVPVHCWNICPVFLSAKALAVNFRTPQLKSAKIFVMCLCGNICLHWAERKGREKKKRVSDRAGIQNKIPIPVTVVKVQSYRISTVHYRFSCNKTIEAGYINKYYWALSLRTLVSCRLTVTVTTHCRLSQNWPISSAW